MEKELWSKIAEDYEMAKKYLWCPKDAVNWHRDEEQGYYYLWCAYHAATVSEEKDFLLYARILMMMSQESHNITDYRRFHALIAPAMAAYEAAISSGCSVSEKELSEVRRTYDRLLYVLKKTDETPEEIENAYSLIEGLPGVEDFCFHDSKPIYFELQKECALLKLDYNGLCVTFEFTGLMNVHVETDPVCDWIDEFYCYPLFDNPKHLYFDVGFYRITCEHIRVVDITRNSECSGV